MTDLIVRTPRGRNRCVAVEPDADTYTYARCWRRANTLTVGRHAGQQIVVFLCSEHAAAAGIAGTTERQATP